MSPYMHADQFTGRTSNNASITGKLALRRFFIEKYHAESRPSVLDCCQGEGLVWAALRREFDVKYLGVDRLPKRGRLSIDSVRMLDVATLPYDIIDVDTYGSPWRHWETLLPNIVKPTTVFLTLGKMATSLATVDVTVRKVLGLTSLSRVPPKTLLWRMDDISIAPCLARSYHYGVRIIEAQRLVPSLAPGQRHNAHYFGVRLDPTSTATN